MSRPPSAPTEWGTRLSDRVRARLDAGDFSGARRLVAEGDGEARSLEKEYALMYKGLGITIRILLGLLRSMLARQAASPRSREVLGELLRRFRRDMVTLLRETCGELGGFEAAPDVAAVETELGRTEVLLAEAEDVFAREQARLAQEVCRAIEARDGGRARALVDQKERGQYVPLHDRLIRLMAELFGYVLAQFGPAELYRFHRETAERQREGFEKWERLPPAEFARATVFLVKQHMGAMEIREDDEKFTLIQTPCGSGGRLRLARAYEGPDALPFVEERGPLTAGQPRLPVYCSHCPLWNSVAAIEWFGRPQWVFEDPARPDGSCTVHVYKGRDRVPPSYYHRLGLPAPATEDAGRPRIPAP